MNVSRLLNGFVVGVDAVCVVDIATGDVEVVEDSSVGGVREKFEQFDCIRVEPVGWDGVVYKGIADIGSATRDQAGSGGIKYSSRGKVTAESVTAAAALKGDQVGEVRIAA